MHKPIKNIVPKMNRKEEGEEEKIRGRRRRRK
jgi:hypothetical protein